MTSHSMFFYIFVKSHLAWRTQADWCLCLKFQTRYSQWKHSTWRIIVVNFAGNLLKLPCQQISQWENRRTQPQPTRQESSPAPWASCWSWQDGSQSCSTEKVVKSIRMTFVASWPGNPQRTACPSILKQKDTLSCSWQNKRAVWLSDLAVMLLIMQIIIIHLAWRIHADWCLCFQPRIPSPHWKHRTCNGALCQ